LKQLGKEKLTDLAILTDTKLQRFGSVTISLKKLSQGVGNTYMHWINLFDNLKDDMFDG